MISALSPGLCQNQVPAVHRGKQVLIFPRELEKKKKKSKRSSEQVKKACNFQMNADSILMLPSSTTYLTAIHHTPREKCVSSSWLPPLPRGTQPCTPRPLSTALGEPACLSSTRPPAPQPASSAQTAPTAPSPPTCWEDTRQQHLLLLPPLASPSPGPQSPEAAAQLCNRGDQCTTDPPPAQSHVLSADTTGSSVPVWCWPNQDGGVTRQTPHAKTHSRLPTAAPPLWCRKGTYISLPTQKLPV